MKNDKTILGQFYTTQWKNILQGFYIPDNVDTIIEPFCGNGDLLKFISENSEKTYTLELYDIDPKLTSCVKQDTLLTPPDYNGKFVITNPPYFSRNKNQNKVYYDKYNVNDLYKCFIKEILDNSPSGGIIIIPLNFWCSVRIADINLRKQFLETFKVYRVNIFEQGVFDDTNYSVCAIQFQKYIETKHEFDMYCFPSLQIVKANLNQHNNYTIGGEILVLPKNDTYIISRVVSEENTLKENDIELSTKLVVYCIDGTSDLHKIRMEYIENDNDILTFIDTTPKHSERNKLLLSIHPVLTETKQKQLSEQFNSFLNEKRKEFNSLFLPNFRENNRKRIPFYVIYNIIGYLLK